MNYSYRDVERNAVVGAFTDSDFASGFHRVQGQQAAAVLQHREELPVPDDVLLHRVRCVEPARSPVRRPTRCRSTWWQRSRPSGPDGCHATVTRDGQHGVSTNPMFSKEQQMITKRAGYGAIVALTLRHQHAPHSPPAPSTSTVRARCIRSPRRSPRSSRASAAAPASPSASPVPAAASSASAAARPTFPTRRDRS